MFARTFRRTVLVVVVAAALLAPVAQADDWARDRQVALDPAIAAAIHDRPAVTTEPVALDPAIRAALLDRARSATRPDDQAGTRGVGSLPQPNAQPVGHEFDWSVVSIGAGFTFAALLLALGSVIAVRHGRARVGNA